MSVLSELDRVALLEESYERLWHRHWALVRRLRGEVSAVEDRPLPSPSELRKPEDAP